MKYSPISLNKKFSRFSDQWSPKIVARMNNIDFKLVKVRGDFIWHSHELTDEAFIVLEGTMRIDFRDGSVELAKGDMFVVPRGTEHKSFAEKECRIMLVEPAGTSNTGGAGGALTAENEVWI